MGHNGCCERSEAGSALLAELFKVPEFVRRRHSSDDEEPTFYGEVLGVEVRAGGTTMWFKPTEAESIAAVMSNRACKSFEVEFAPGRSGPGWREDTPLGYWIVWNLDRKAPQ